MRKGLSQALDECLAHLKQGESIETCLQRFPHERQELEPLLRLAQALQESHMAQVPGQQALMRGRAAFLGQAAPHQRASTAPSALADWARGLLRSEQHPLARVLMTLSVTVALVLGALAGGNIASANSLPGDPLYSVKRASEQVRVLLTINADSRAALEEELAERRVSEVKQVLKQGREAQVDLNGTVEKVEGDWITIQGIAIRLAADALHGQPPAIGSQVAVVVQTQKDGTAHATMLDVKAVPTAPIPTAKPPTLIVTQPAQVRPTQVVKATSTPKPTDTSTPLPTNTPCMTITVAVTSTVSASVTPTVEEATETATFVPSPTPEPTATIAPPPRDTKVRIEGRIDAISSQEWTVSGQRLMVRSSTRIRQEGAKAEVGGWAVVDAIKHSSGELEAREIVVLRGADQPPQAIEFSGLIEEISGDSWLVAGRRVQIVAETVIEGAARVGAVVHVKADQYADGRLVAKRITVQSDVEQVVQFEGIIQSIGEDRWVVAGQELVIDEHTDISGDPVIGAVAEVEAVVRADGSRLARSIRVKATPSPEPSLTPTEATPIPTEVTPVPTQTLITEPTATATPVIPIMPSPAAEEPAPALTATVALIEAPVKY
jgi:hypothetical protein